jgi:excinuclease ABC subunit A
MTRRYGSTTSDGVKSDIEKLMRAAPCHDCEGKRLKKEALAVRVGGKNIWDVCELSVDKLCDFMDELQPTLTTTEHLIADAIIKEINNRLGFLRNVGLNYLTLTRTAVTLSL